MLLFNILLFLPIVSGYYRKTLSNNRYFSNFNHHDSDKTFHSIGHIDSDLSSEKQQFSNKLTFVAKVISIHLSTLGLFVRENRAETDIASTIINDDYSPMITEKVFLDIKIANYTEESKGKNRAAQGSGKIVIGLYGKDAPQSVAIFLETIRSNGTSLPTYYNSQFSRLSEEGIMEVEKVRGINSITIAGVEKYEYAGNVLDYKPILEPNRISHNRRGLLTRKQLTAGPEFGITLKENKELDAFHIAFGEVLDGFEVLDAIANIPTYTYSTKTEKGVEGGLADKWFESQKSFYVGVGKTFGDLRAVDRRGKPLRRITIKNAGLLNR
eukprot:gene8017-10865_t